MGSGWGVKGGETSAEGGQRMSGSWKPHEATVVHVCRCIFLPEPKDQVDRKGAMSDIYHKQSYWVTQTLEGPTSNSPTRWQF